MARKSWYRNTPVWKRPDCPLLVTTVVFDGLLKLTEFGQIARPPFVLPEGLSRIDLQLLEID